MRSLVQIAQGEVGVREEGGNNCGPRVREYQAATWLTVASWAWCAVFTAWCLRDWLKQPEVTQMIKDTVGGPNFNLEKWRCRDAAVFGWDDWAIRTGGKVLDPTKHLAEAGDFVIFDFNGPETGGGHIGIVEVNQKPHESVIYTIEGNTNGKGERDSISGDGVWRKTRKTTLVKHYIRMAIK